MKPFLSVIIPTQNHARTLSLALIATDHHLARFGKPYEIIVVDAGSTDATPEVARRFRPLIKNLRVISLKEGSLGRAAKTGLLEGGGEWRVIFPAGSHIAIDELEKAWPHLETGYDIAVGSPSLARSHAAPRLQFHHGLFRMLHNLVIGVVARPGVYDAESGFVIIRGRAAEDLLPLSHLETAGYLVELLALARRRGLKIKEFPINFINDHHFDFRHHREIIGDAFKILTRGR